MKRNPLRFALAVVLAGALFPSGAPAVDHSAFVPAEALEAGVLTRLNALRAGKGLKPLRVSQALASAARQHTRDMARNEFCSHDSGDGTDFWGRVSRFYAQGRGWRSWAAGEIVLCHPRRLTAAAALREWLRSPGHRANLLSSQWREVGVAAVYAASSGGQLAGADTVYVTADFGTRS